jgi:hypothetical protein
VYVRIDKTDRLFGAHSIWCLSTFSIASSQKA